MGKPVGKRIVVEGTIRFCVLIPPECISGTSPDQLAKEVIEAAVPPSGIAFSESGTKHKICFFLQTTEPQVDRVRHVERPGCSDCDDCVANPHHHTQSN